MSRRTGSDNGHSQEVMDPEKETINLNDYRFIDPKLRVVCNLLPFGKLNYLSLIHI